MYNLNHATILLGSKNLEGNINEPKYAISPILVEFEKGNYKCLGTCFFIRETGIFITSAHIINEVFPKKIPENKKSYLDEPFDKDKIINVDKGIIVPQFLPDNKVLFRRVLWTNMLSADDAAIGVVEGMKNEQGETIKTVPLVLSARDAKEGDTLFTYAYPESKRLGNSFEVNSSLSMDLLTKHYPNGRDSCLIPFPCYETKILTSGGASGGPVINLLGAVVGVNTSGVGDTHFVSKINNILSFEVPDGSIDKMISLEQLGKIGKIYNFIWDSNGNTDSNVDYEYQFLKFKIRKVE